METGAVVVAAGMSSRMGDFKPMLSIGEISVAQRVVATLRQAGAERVVVVTGYNADELERHLSKSGAVFVRNEEYRTTEMFDSALIGLKYIRGKCDRILFTPVDVPLFTAATVRELLDSGAELACPVCGGQRGHPILMSPDVVDRLLRDSGEDGLKGALGRCGVPMTLVDVPDPGILHDADTPEDYRQLLELHNSQLVRPVLQVSVARQLTFLDGRVAMMLQLIGETGSVREACQRIQMSYSSGWNAIRTLENELGFTVVSRTQGGARGGSSSITKEGAELLKRYEGFRRELCAEADRLFERYFAGMFGDGGSAAAAEHFEKEV
ncbi:MAG TPA: NTP transferase domain-containing protein [Candidatus Scatomorpha intestinavium]|uniref:NTP transferase domain-containing protein n=1 Tax=Candidatus Scatomorpha intestinavium TaxID=2840922 RepID=A0A9D0ZFX3_9FIRM|nr:NTP transferase domain-containing protein [Candidatus Scatomorpha intestinavium]